MDRLLALAAAALLAAPSAASPDGLFDGTGGPPPAGLAAPPPPAPPPRDPRSWVSARAADAEARTAVADAGVSIEEILPGRVAGIASPEALERLRAAGIAFTAVPLPEFFGPEDFPERDSIYHDYERLSAALKGLAESHKDAATLFSIGKSLKGLDLWALRIAAPGLDGPRPAIAFLGTHHAREHLSTEVPLGLARHLLENRDSPSLSKLLASREVFIVPMVNPDGVEYDIEDGRYRMHRKNLRRNEDGSLGVDLNRNYGYRWGGRGASDRPRDETYRGPSPFSEPETRAVRSFIEERKATLKILLSYHTFSELILYPWGHTREPLGDGRALAAYKAMAAAMGGMTGYTPMQSSSLYIASGDTTDWAWGEHGIFSFTFELTPKSSWGGGFYPGPGAVATTVQNNIGAALYLIELADDPLRAADGLALTGAGPAAGGR